MDLQMWHCFKKSSFVTKKRGVELLLKIFNQILDIPLYPLISVALTPYQRNSLCSSMRPLHKVMSGNTEGAQPQLYVYNTTPAHSALGTSQTREVRKFQESTDQKVCHKIESCRYDREAAL